MVLGALLDSTVSICIEQLAQVLDLAANLGASIGVAHHATTVGLVKAVGLAFDVDVARERLGNGRKCLVRLEAASARARDERIAGDTCLGMVGATETAIDDQQLAVGADGLLALGGLNGVWPLMMWPVGEQAMGATPNSRMMSSQTEGDLVSVKYGSIGSTHVLLSAM